MTHRPSWRRGFGAVAGTVLTIGVLTACESTTVSGRAVSGPPTGSGTASGGSGAVPASGTLTWGESTPFPTNLMPLILEGNTTAVANLEVRVLDGLYRTSPDVAYVADPDQGVASSSVVAGKQVIDVRIDPDAVWADGRPITADDYVFTADTLRSGNPSDGGCAGLVTTGGFDAVASTDVVDRKHVRFTMRTPLADWAGLFSGGSTALLAQHVIDQGSASATCAYITKGWPAAGGIPLGAQNGPWLLLADNVDTATKQITLVPNPRYWGDKPKLSRLVIRTIGDDPDTTLAALRNGDVDTVYPLAQLDLASRLRQLPDVTTETTFGITYEHLDFNTRDPLLKYPQIRQAIAAAIDRPALVAATVGRYSDRARPLGNRLLITTQEGYVDNSGEYARPDVSRAKRLIESVGGTLGSDGIYRVGGRALTFRVSTTQGNPLRDTTITTLATQARAAGIRLTEFANPTIFGTASEPGSLESGDFQIALFAWINTASLSGSDPIYRSPDAGGAQNYSRGGDVEVDRALARASAALSREAQVAALNDADRLLWRDMFTLPLYQKPTVLAYRNSVQGLHDNNSLAGPLWNSDEVSVR